MVFAAYDYWGYGNVCFLGDEIKDPGKNIPRALHRRLRESASEHHRSLNGEILAQLQASMGAAPLDPEAWLTRIRAVRQRVSGRLTAGLLAQAKRGRP